MNGFGWLFLLILFSVDCLGHGSVNYVPLDQDEMLCSTSLGELGNLPCYHAQVVVIETTTLELENIFKKEDLNLSVRRLSIRIICSSVSMISSIRNAMDVVLAPRPWWLTMKEDEKQTPKQRKKFSYLIYLVRQYQIIEPQLRLLAAMQFPPQHICAETRLGVGHLVDSGWGAQLGMYGSFVKKHPWVIFNIWDSLTNMPQYGVHYSAPETCPDVINKRLCAFLPLTNCSMPTYMTQPRGAVEVKKVWPSSFAIYSSATTAALPVPDEFNRLKPESPYQRVLYEMYGHVIRNRANRFVLEKFIDGYNGELSFKALQGSRNSPLVLDTIASYGLIFRPNALYRSLISDRITAFRKQHQFSSNGECIAIHIRRSDRTRVNLDMNQFCRNYTRYSRSKQSPVCEHTITREPQGCLLLDNLGCFSAHPFGSLSLQDYLDRAWQLIPTRNVFVMTDDGEWLDDQRRTVSPEWNVMALSGKREPRTSSKATQGGVDFMASVALARQCRGFVGHWSSSVAVLVFRSMCMQHWRYVGRCPLGFNIGGGPPLSREVKTKLK